MTDTGVCGTQAGNDRHRAMDEKACDPCRSARNAYESRRKAAAKVGKPLSSLRATTANRVLRNVWVEVESGCWLWRGALNWAGYGVFSVGKAKRGAHRISYEVFLGPIPDGLQLDHLCRNPPCVNPDHLEPVTGSENVRRAVGVTACKRSGHEYTPENTRWVYSRKRKLPTRSCRECKREQDREKYAAKREQKRMSKLPIQTM